MDSRGELDGEGRFDALYPGVNELTPHFTERLQAALLDAFPSRNEIEQMVYYGLEVQLDANVGGSTLSELVFNLLKWAKARGLENNLVRAARKANDTNPLLLAFEQLWNSDQGPTQASVISMQAAGAHYDPNWHVSRPRIEKTALTYLRNKGTPAVLYAPHKGGRTWFVNRLLDVGHFETDRLVRLNLLAFLPALNDIDRLVEQIGEQIVHDMNGSPSWLEVVRKRKIAPMVRLGRLLTLHVLRSFDGFLLLAFDEADALLHGDLGVGNTFFGGLRAWMDDKGKPLGDRVRLVLAVSTTPAKLIQGARLSPFNIVPPIEIPPFSLVDVQRLAEKCVPGLSNDDIKKLHEFTGGHPYLTRSVLYESVLDGNRSLPMNPYTPLFRSHLEGLRRYVREAHLEVPFRAILSGSAHVDVDDEERLVRAGLVKRDAGSCLLPSCELYSHYFTKAL